LPVGSVLSVNILCTFEEDLRPSFSSCRTGPDLDEFILEIVSGITPFVLNVKRLLHLENTEVAVPRVEPEDIHFILVCSFPESLMHDSPFRVCLPDNREQAPELIRCMIPLAAGLRLLL
jgi:hypothetical protein